MAQTQSVMKYKRAVVVFVIAYVVINILAPLFTIIVAAVMHTNLGNTATAVHTRAYVASERFYPLLNLAVWLPFAWIYFKKHAGVLPAIQEAVRLGVLWLVLALPFDLIFYVLIKTPYSLSFHDFYIGQAPWLYLIYLAVFISPLLSYILQKILAGKHKLPVNN